MTPKEVRELLYRVAKIMVPRFRGRKEEPTAREKIEEMEDHLFVIARWRCALDEARLWMNDATRQLEDQWEDIEGWQTVADGKTKQAVVTAKRTLRPELYDGIREGKFLIERLGEQIRRLERDEEQTISRAYTLISGG